MSYVEKARTNEKSVFSKICVDICRNKIFKKGDFVTYEPGSKHSSYTKKGCLILTFMRGINKPSKEN